MGVVLAIVVFTALLFGVPLMMGWFEARRPRDEDIRPTSSAIDPPTGYWRMLTVAGVSVLVRGSVLVTALVIAIGCSFFSTILSVDYKFNPLDLLYFATGYLVIICLHESGHVVAAKYLGLKVSAVELSDLGGLVQCETPKDAKSGLVLYSAGVAAQLALLVLTLGCVAWLGKPSGGLALCLVLSFTFVNVLLLVINLIPRMTAFGAPTDGYMLWGLFLHLWKNAPSPLHGVLLPADTRLETVQGFLPENFVTGVEILNDAATPMEFVVDTLCRHLRMDRKSAIELMLTIHSKGGAMVPLASAEEALTVAAGVAADNQSSGYKLTCRAVDLAGQARGHED